MSSATCACLAPTNEAGDGAALSEANRLRLFFAGDPEDGRIPYRSREEVVVQLVERVGGADHAFSSHRHPPALQTSDGLDYVDGFDG